MARFIIDEKRDIKGMIYKAKVIGNAYDPKFKKDTILSSTNDGVYSDSEIQTDYYYELSNLIMIISRIHNNDNSKELYNLKIKQNKDVKLDTKEKFYDGGMWEEIFDNMYKKAVLQMEAIKSMDKFTITEHNSKEKVKELKKEN